MTATEPNKSTGANAGGPFLFTIQARRVARIARFCRWATPGTT